MIIHSRHYASLLNGLINLGNNDITLVDHLGGFDFDQHNIILDYLSTKNYKNKFFTQYCFDKSIAEKYSNIDVNFSASLQNQINFSALQQYNQHPDIDFKNFICSFNGSGHVGRKLLVAILHRFGFFNDQYCSKNVAFTVDILDGHISEICSNDFLRKFFISDNSQTFFQNVYSFGYVATMMHNSNIYKLETKLTQSFLHIVSETMATSYVPFVTEKFLYSIITRGLFLSYAQPGWHKHVEKCYGFKLYDRLFDYRFDLIQNPVERLVELMCMISKFSVLSCDDWRDLWQIQQDEIEYNYHHYFSGDYLRCMQKYG